MQSAATQAQDHRAARRGWWLAPSLALVTAAAVTTSCDKIPVDPGSAVSAAAGCPDVSSISAIAKYDWAGEFGIDVQAAAKISAGLQAAISLQAFAAKLDADLKTACGGLAKDLGVAGDFDNGEAACKAALSGMADLKAQMGGSVKITLDVQPPYCSASMEAMADCAAQCDAELEPGSVEVECEPGKLSGECSAQCKGRCDMKAAAKCEGTCQGSCDASFSGKCGGDCNGKCDGKKANGPCAGKCEGSCSANAEGSCGGQCSGSCQMEAAAKCQGTCTGECSVEMKAPRCEGEMKPPKASAECEASCDASVQAEVDCTPPRIVLRVDGAANAEAAAKFKAALEANLPGILKIAIGMKDQALSVATSVKDVVGGVEVTIKSLKAAPEVGARLTACVAAPFKAAFDAAASVKVNVDVSVEVKASASASGSASTG